METYVSLNYILLLFNIYAGKEVKYWILLIYATQVRSRFVAPTF